MRQEEPENGGPLELFEALRKIVPFESDATSEPLEWGSLEAIRYRELPGSEVHSTALTHHQLTLFVRPPEKLSLVYEGVHRHGPPPAGAISLIPAGRPSLWRWSGRADSLHI